MQPLWIVFVDWSLAIITKKIRNFLNYELLIIM